MSQTYNGEVETDSKIIENILYIPIKHLSIKADRKERCFWICVHPSIYMCLQMSILLTMTYSNSNPFKSKVIHSWFVQPIPTKEVLALLPNLVSSQKFIIHVYSFFFFSFFFNNIITITFQFVTIHNFCGGSNNNFFPKPSPKQKVFFICKTLRVPGLENQMDRQEERLPSSLESPLLLNSDERISLIGFKKSLNRENIVAEVKRQLWLAGPLMSVNLLMYSLQVISVMFVGHLGELALSGASMATSFASVTGFSLLIGMGSALDTLCGQSYGAKQYHMLGVHMQRAMVVLLLVSVPLAFVWFNTGHILTVLGQDPEIAAEAGQYARFMIPSIFAYAILQCHIRFLQTQNNVFPMMISTGITTLVHIFMCWILVFKSGLGNKGAALANATSYWINVLLLVLYVNFSPACKKTWTGFSREALHNVLHFLKLGIPSALMVCLEIWTFEMMVLLSGLLPNPRLETSVLSISLNTCAMVYMIPLGLSSAVSTRVSNELGAGRPQAARLAVCVTTFMFMIVGMVVSSVMILVRREWGKCYSNEEEVVRYVATMLPILAASYLLDGIQSVLSGTVRGCGRQKIGAIINLGAYYLIGIPSSIVFAFVFHIGGKGLWLGIICGLFVQAFVLLIITVRTDWDEQAKKATDRVYNAFVPIDVE